MSGLGNIAVSTASRIIGGLLRFRRAPWENLATILIALGVLMLMQPFSLAAYGHSLAVTLIGTAMFLVVSKFPD